MNTRVKLVLVLAIAAGLLGTVAMAAAGTGPSEAELLNKACEYSNQGDHAKAVAVLEGLLPTTKNGDVYWKLGEILDNSMRDYGKAIAVYREYLEVFPDGWYAERFRQRLDYLERHRGDWPALARYNFILGTHYTRSRTENIRLMESVLRDYPKTGIAPDIYSCLAWEYYLDNQTKAATGYITRYLGTFPANGKPVTDKIGAYQTYALILMRARRYGQAIGVLRGSLADPGIDPSVYANDIRMIEKERRIWYGLVIAVGSLFLALILAVVLQPWRERSFRTGWPRLLVPAALLAALTLLPMKIVQAKGYGLFKTFPTLSVSAVVILLLLKSLGAVAHKIGPRVYLVLSFLVIAAGIYISFYAWDTLSVFYQLPDFGAQG